MTIDPYISYADATPDALTADDVVKAAANYVGAQWGAVNCTGLVWAVAYGVGAPFYETLAQVEAGAGETAQQIVGAGGTVPDPDHTAGFPGYVVPVRSTIGAEFSVTNTAALAGVHGVADTLGSEWTLVNGRASTDYLSVIGNTSALDEPQPGDLFRGVAINAGAGKCIMHSGIVKAYDPATGLLTLISNWNTATEVIGVDQFKLITNVGQAVAGHGPYILANKLALYRLLPPATTLPDVVIDDLKVSPAATIGGGLQISATVGNNSAVAAGAFTFNVYVSPHQHLDTAVHLLATVPVTGLARSASTPWGESAKVPGWITAPGQYYVIVDANPDKSLSETNYDNDSFSVAFQVMAPIPSVVSSGQIVHIYSGQTGTGIKVENGGTLIVEHGGSASASTVSRGAFEYVSRGGTEKNASIAGTLHDGGLASAATIHSGGLLSVDAGGTASAATVQSGGKLIVSSGGTAINGANSGQETISAGGSDRGATLALGAVQKVLGEARSVFVGSAASQVVLRGGTAIGTTLGGSDIIGFGGLQTVSAGGTALGTMVSRGGDQSVSASGVASGAMVFGVEGVRGIASASVIKSGGQQYVSSTGRAVSTTISQGGLETVFSNGVASGTSIIGGEQDIQDGGAVTSTTIRSGGRQFVYRSGTAARTIVSSGGLEIVASHGFASGSVISNGGSAIVQNGGVAVAATIMTGGYEIVSSGGTSSATTINRGTLEIGTGGSIGGSVAFASDTGGTLVLDSSLTFHGLVAGFGGADRIDLRDLAFKSGHMTLKFLEAGNHSSGTLTVSNGAQSVQLTLLSQYVAGQFHAASDGHGGTVITDPPLPEAELAGGELLAVVHPS